MRAIIADDQPLFRNALVDIVRQLGEPASVQECDASAQLLAMGETGGKAAEPVDLLCIGIDLLGGAENLSLAKLRQRFAHGRLVLIAGRCSPVEADACVRQGAAGILLRSDSPQLMQSALRLALAGGTFMPTRRAADSAGPDYAATENAPRQAGGLGDVPQAELDRKAPLTQRQSAVLALIGRGWSNRRIAGQLGVSEGTVKVHVNAILRALKFRNRTQAALYATNSPVDLAESRAE
jgi:DNA-binding NarL/FixJ family response regulator